MNTATLDDQNTAGPADNAEVLVIDKDNSLDMDLVYGSDAPRKPRHHEIAEHTSQYEWREPYTVWMAFGECDPQWLKSILKSITKDSKLIFIDACTPGTYRLNKSECDSLRTYIAKGQLQIITSGTYEQKGEHFVDLVNIKMMDNWHPLIPQSMVNSCPEAVHKLITTIGAKLNTKILFKNTIEITSSAFLKNALINAPLASKKSPLNNILQNHQQKPVLIVSAGPSLNKQLPILRENQELFTILAVDTVWKILNDNNIVPDVILGIDSQSRPSWPANHLNQQTQLVVDIGCSPELVWSHNANHVFTYANILIQDCIQKLGGHADFLDTGGSVATSAFELARSMNANPIVLIGQDLALTGGRDHADGYPHTYSAELLAERTEAGFDVEGYYPGKVRTERGLMLYKTWFEEQISDMNETLVINATEGGARIHGAIQLPFMQVCDEIRQTSIRKIPLESPEVTNIGQNHLIQLIESLTSTISELANLQKILDEGFEICEAANHSAPTIKHKIIGKLDFINKKIKAIKKETKFILESFSQRQLEEVTRSASRVGKRMTIQKEIEMYKFIYKEMNESSTTSMKMLNDVLDFYKFLLKFKNMQPHELIKFIIQ